MQNVTAVGHRGDPYRVRENTIDSLRSALDQGADAVEFDVRLTRDGVPVLLHDETLSRLWELDRPLKSLSVDEVRGLTDGRVPTLVEALAATEGSRVMVDLPGPADPRAVRRIVDEIREFGADDRVYYCAGADAMLAVRAADPSAEIALTWTSLAPRAPRSSKRYGRAGSTTASRWSIGTSPPASTATVTSCRSGPRTPAARCAASSTWASTRSPPTGSTCSAGSGRRAEGSVPPPRRLPWRGDGLSVHPLPHPQPDQQRGGRLQQPRTLTQLPCREWLTAHIPHQLPYDREGFGVVPAQRHAERTAVEHRRRQTPDVLVAKVERLDDVGLGPDCGGELPGGGRNARGEGPEAVADGVRAVDQHPPDKGSCRATSATPGTARAGSAEPPSPGRSGSCG